MELIVRRKWLTDESSTGVLLLDGVYECFTLEDRVRAAGVKVDGKTAIPRGRYPLAIDFSTRFRRYMPHIMGVPMFTGIRIHSGNTDADTEGCILLGDVKGIDEVLASREAFQRFWEKLAVGGSMDDTGVQIFNLRQPTWVTVLTEPESDTRTGDLGGVDEPPEQAQGTGLV